MCQLLNTAVPVSWMECVKTREYRSFTCWPCVLAAAGSSRFRRFNLSLRKADVSGSWRTWEVTTANSPRGLPSRDSAEPLPFGAGLRGQRAGTVWAPPTARSPGPPPHDPPDVATPLALSHAPVSPSVSQKHFPASSLTLRPHSPLARVLRAAQPSLLDVPNFVQWSFKCISKATLQRHEGRNKS